MVMLMMTIIITMSIIGIVLVVCGRRGGEIGGVNRLAKRSLENSP